MTLDDAAAENVLPETEIEGLYASLVELLENEDYERAVLYIPFEFLPDAFKESSHGTLRHSAEKFKDAYMKAWHSTLKFHDVRANFVDGDVLEADLRTEDLPRVVKAAHLIPKLMERGFMHMEDVFTLLETSDDEILRQSVIDTLPVLADLGLLRPEDLATLRASRNPMIRDAALAIASNKQEHRPDQDAGSISFPDMQNRLRKDLARIDTTDYGAASPKRTHWLKEEAKRKTIDAMSDTISDAIKKNEFPAELTTEFLSTEADSSTQESYIAGIRKSIETIAETDSTQAKTLYERNKDTLLSLWKKNSPEIRAALSKTFFRFHELGMVDDQRLRELDMAIPALAGPFSENLKSMDPEVRDIKSMVAVMETDPELAECVYPMVIVYGSRLKGYGGENADIDIAVMIKPDVATERRGKIQERLKAVFVHEKIRGAITEFWLEKTEEGLGVRDLNRPDAATGEKYWTHVLFGGAWEGETSTVDELRKKLLVPYFSETSTMIYGHNARELYLEEMERDTLQYRLMHKGYERFFPAYGGMKTPHGDRIDGESIFWDSGYRDAAIKLFANRVFLPKISSRKSNS
jgi:predicted nucleotidyltransferase